MHYLIEKVTKCIARLDMIRAMRKPVLLHMQKQKRRLAALLPHS